MAMHQDRRKRQFNLGQPSGWDKQLFQAIFIKCISRIWEVDTADLGVKMEKIQVIKGRSNMITSLSDTLEALHHYMLELL